MTYVRNGELLREVAEQIRRDPASHDQTLWVQPSDESDCGTAYCVAGWAVALGMDWRWRTRLGWHKAGNPRKPVSVSRAARATSREPGEPGNPFEIESTSRLAADLLGIEGDPGDLFAGSLGPLDGLSVPEALEEIAAGSPVEDVWGGEKDGPCPCPGCLAALNDEEAW